MSPYHLMTDDVLQILLELRERDVLPSWTCGQACIVGSEEDNLKLSKRTPQRGTPAVPSCGQSLASHWA